MKKLIIGICLLFAVLLVYAASSWDYNATTNVGNNYKSVYFEATIDSVDTLTSDSYEFDDYGQVVHGAYILTSVKGMPKIKVIKQESYFDGSWVTAKTLFDDSVETQKTFTDTVLTKSRIIIIGNALNRSDTEIKIINKGFK